MDGDRALTEIAPVNTLVVYEIDAYCAVYS